MRGSIKLAIDLEDIAFLTSIGLLLKSLLKFELTLLSPFFHVIQRLFLLIQYLGWEF